MTKKELRKAVIEYLQNLTDEIKWNTKDSTARLMVIAKDNGFLIDPEMMDTLGSTNDAEEMNDILGSAMETETETETETENEQNLSSVQSDIPKPKKERTQKTTSKKDNLEIDTSTSSVTSQEEIIEPKKDNTIYWILGGLLLAYLAKMLYDKSKANGND